MRSFWKYARLLGRFPGRLSAALCFAGLSALALGAGFAGVVPIIETILDGRGTEGGVAKGLPDLARELNAWLGGVGLGVFTLPEAWIEGLSPKPYHAVLVIMVGLGVLTVFGALTTFLHQYLSISVVQHTTTELRKRAYGKLLRAPLSAVVSSGTADPVSRVVVDTQQLAAGLTALVSRGVFQVTRGLVMLIAAFVMNWKLSLIALAVAPVLGVVVRQLGGKIRKSTRRALREQASLYGSALDALRGLRVVKVHTTEGMELEAFSKKNLEVMRQVFRARTARAASSPIVEVVTLVALGTLTVVATKAVLDGELDETELLMTLAALFIAATALRPLTGIINEIQTADGAAERIDELFAEPDEPGHDPSLPTLPRHAESIVFDQVTYTYPGAERASLDRVSLEIRAGERVAVVGPNGSGKTTLLSLVPRLYDPDATEPPGGVRIDGHDLREVHIGSLRDQLGVVTQETVLFPGTIRSNIAYGTEGKSDDEITDAAKRAHAWGFVEKLPEGLDTPVAEQGLSLSGGQRQRIAIARAILRDPSILILDEATSMIDAESEALIAEALEAFSAGRTTLIVAHRLSTVVNADRIVVMDQGRVADVGKHEELLGRCRVYQLLARTQLVGAG